MATEKPSAHLQARAQQSIAMTKIPDILVFCDYYLPGYKAGGPVRTLSNMIDLLGDRYEFNVITRDRDLGEEEPYGNDYTAARTLIGKALVTFLPPSRQSFSAIAKEMRSLRHDLLYLNSFFSINFSIKPLLLRRIGLVPEKPVILAPRGEFSAAAMNIRGLKKRIFIFAARITGSHTNVVWQASSDYEAEDIRRHWGADARIIVAADLSAAASAAMPSNRSAKVPGCLHAVFLSRISEMKHLDFALRLLDGLRGQVSIDIYGPIEDSRYWKGCQGIIELLPDNINARYCGEIPNEQVNHVLSRYDLFLLPTRGENFGHAIFEALSSGCPVLISDRTPWRNLDTLGIGWDVPLESPALFREIIQGCIDMDDRTLTQISTRAQAYAASPERQRTAIEMNCALFDSVLESADNGC
jgi:glycosyltransferase involved in cell wall biosynthesis